jgi:hypothetical protein
MYVIASQGHAIINGLGQVKVWEDFDDAVLAGANMVANGQKLWEFRVQEVHLIPKGSVKVEHESIVGHRQERA